MRWNWKSTWRMYDFLQKGTKKRLILWGKKRRNYRRVGEQAVIVKRVL